MKICDFPEREGIGERFGACDKKYVERTRESIQLRKERLRTADDRPGSFPGRVLVHEPEIA